MWNPTQYQRFSDERARPFFDLLARVGVERPSDVADLGCGPGNLTRALAERWPDARVVGVDSSPAMIEAAASHAIPGRLSFVRGDLAAWEPPRALDAIVANASLQWTSDHATLLVRLAGLLAARGQLAIQMPANFDQPSHTLLAEVASRPRWAPKLGGLAARRAPVHEAVFYVDRLGDLGLAVDAWETTYFHLLQGEDAVLEWTSGTALRPALALLDAEEQALLRAEYGGLLRAAYPRGPRGTLFPFKRMFVVATKP